MTQRPSPQPLIRNVRWNLAGNVSYAVGGWLQLAILARIGGAAALGLYAWCLALTAPVMMFGYLQLRVLLATDTAAAYDFREYRRLRLATTVASLIAIAAIAAFTGADRATWSVLAPVSVMRAADSMSDLYFALWQRHERMSVNGFGLIVNAAVSVLLMAAFGALGWGAPGAAVGSALGSSAALAFVYVRTRCDREVRTSMVPARPLATSRQLRLAKEAAPLGVIVLLGSLLQNVPRYFVRYHAGEAALGLFAAASQLTTAGGIVIAALGNGAMPRLARMLDAADVPAFRKLTRTLVRTGAGLAIAGVALSLLIGRPVLAALFRPEFGEAADVLVVLSAAAGVGFVATLLGYALTAARIIAVQPLLLAAALGVVAACCAALVPAWGSMGAAWALVAGSAVQALCAAVALRRNRLPHPAAQAAADAR